MIQTAHSSKPVVFRLLLPTHQELKNAPIFGWLRSMKTFARKDSKGKSPHPCSAEHRLVDSLQTHTFCIRFSCRSNLAFIFFEAARELIRVCYSATRASCGFHPVTFRFSQWLQVHAWAGDLAHRTQSWSSTAGWAGELLIKAVSKQHLFFSAGNLENCLSCFQKFIAVSHCLFLLRCFHYLVVFLTFVLSSPFHVVLEEGISFGQLNILLQWSSWKGSLMSRQSVSSFSFLIGCISSTGVGIIFHKWSLQVKLKVHCKYGSVNTAWRHLYIYVSIWKYTSE